MKVATTFLLVAAALALAACSREEPASTPDAAPAAPAVAPEPTSTPAPEPVAGPKAATDPAATAAGTDAVTGYHGFGPARFGDSAEAVRIAWGRPLVADRQTTPDTPCVYLNPEPAPSDAMRIAFMLDYDKFVRYDVSGAGYPAPGGGLVGNDHAALESMYAGRFTVAPHKYVEGGQYFVVAGPDGSESRLVFELDADGKVSEWRVGVPPQIDYVEGCG